MLVFLKKRWVYHGLIWLFVTLIVLMLDWDEEMIEEGVLHFLFSSCGVLIPAMYVVYSNFYAKEHLFEKRRYVLYFTSLLFIVASGTFFLVWIRHFSGVVNISLQQEIVNVVAIIPISIGLQYFKRGIVNQYQLQELRIKTVETELNALKAQINPHFLFNTLNNIYGMNQSDPESASEMIIELSDVMRYHLEFSKEGLVNLKDELSLLRSYIQLEKLRLNENCDLRWDFTNVIDSLMVSPLLFLPFIENAFKHGTHPVRPCFVHVHFRADAETIVFDIRNSVVSNGKTIKTHVGIENTKRRLELIYGKNHSLSIENDQATHHVNLTINL